MQKSALETIISQSLSDLLKLADKFCVNKVSSNFKFILSDFQDGEGLNFHEIRKLKNKNNNRKVPQDLADIIDFLHQEFADLYDVTLYVFHARKEVTIIELEYVRKSNLSVAYYDKIKDVSPLFHSKIVLPGYYKDNENKFDINWHHEGFIHLWKSFIFDFKIRNVRKEVQKKYRP